MPPQPEKNNKKTQLERGRAKRRIMNSPFLTITTHTLPRRRQAGAGREGSLPFRYVLPRGNPQALSALRQATPDVGIPRIPERGQQPGITV